MKDFDISSLLNFEPAKYQCIKCFSLFKQSNILNDLLVFESRKDIFGIPVIKCPNCQLQYNII